MKPIHHDQSPNQLSRKPYSSDETPQPGLIKRLIINNIADAVGARTTARRLAEKLGYDLTDQIRIASIIFELADMAVTGKDSGEILILWYEDRLNIGVKCCCCIKPSAIRLVDQKNSYLKPGISKLKRLADEFEYIEDSQHSDSAPSIDCVAVTVWLKRNS